MNKTHCCSVLARQLMCARSLSHFISLLLEQVGLWMEERRKSGKEGERRRERERGEKGRQRRRERDKEGEGGKEEREMEGGRVGHLSGKLCTGEIMRTDDMTE